MLIGCMTRPESLGRL